MNKLLFLPLIALFISCGQKDQSQSQLQVAARDPLQTFNLIADGVKNGRPVVIWRLLPKSYQDDVEGILRQASQKVDSEVWNSSFVTLNNISSVMKSKRQLFLNYLDQNKAKNPFNGIVAPQNTGKAFDLFANFASELSTSKLSNHSELAGLDLDFFLQTTGAKLIDVAIKFTELSSEKSMLKEIWQSFKGTEARLVSSGSTEAVIEVINNGTPYSVELSNVETRWLPKLLVGSWKGAITDAQSAIGQFSLTPDEVEALKQILADLNQGVNQIKQASNDQEFAAVIEPLIDFVSMVVGSLL